MLRPLFGRGFLRGCLRGLRGRAGALLGQAFWVGGLVEGWRGEDADADAMSAVQVGAIKTRNMANIP